MLISEFIERLQGVKELHGDAAVVFQTLDRHRHLINSIVHETEYSHEINNHYCIDLILKKGESYVAPN